MKTILNFLPIRLGGGLQNALSFLQILAKDPVRQESYLAVVRKDSAIHDTCRQHHIEAIVVEDTSVARFRFELSCKSYFTKGQTCFTFFGPPMLGSKGHLLNVAGCAYSNLFYPEIDFWDYLPWIIKKKAELIDWYRKTVTARADYWIFETPILAKRAVQVCHFPPDRVGVVRMTASSLVSEEMVSQQAVQAFKQKLRSGFKFLFLCGPHPNKQLHLLKAIAVQLINAGMKDFVFVTTMDESSKYASSILADFQSSDLSSHLCNIGPVPSEEVASLISCCDAMCCLSVLESFSNNFVEAWRMKKPLLVTDGDWSRDACGQGALYVDPVKSQECADAMGQFLTNEALQKDLIEAGSTMLESYPTAEEKNSMYYENIDKAQALGSCPCNEKKQICWS